MEINTKGSALLFILLTMASIACIALTVLKSTIIFYDFALERKSHIFQIEAIRALVFYGIAITAYQAEKQKNFEYTKEIAIWPLPHGPYQAQLQITGSVPEYIIIGVMMKNKRCLCSLESHVRIQKNTWHIKKWFYKNNYVS